MRNDTMIGTMSNDTLRGASDSSGGTGTLLGTPTTILAGVASLISSLIAVM